MSGDFGRVGRYHLTRQLGRGGMGIVYAGFDPAISRDVALKTIIPNSSLGEDATQMRDSLLAEARSAGRLHHSSIVAIYDVGLDGDVAYIVMELVNGADLRTLMRNRMPTAAETLKILKATAIAIDFAHQHGVIHRDIKPGNILIDSTGVTKLTDFGISKSNFRESDGRTIHIVGTPAYMSPEQTFPGQISERSDQYSLAVVAYELLTGKLPFEGSGLQSVFEQICSSDRPSASKVNQALPGSVDGVLKRGLAVKARERYENCCEFVSELERCFEPVVSKRSHSRLLWAVPLVIAAAGGFAWYWRMASVTPVLAPHSAQSPSQSVRVPDATIPQGKPVQTAGTNIPSPKLPAEDVNREHLQAQPVTSSTEVTEQSVHPRAIAKSITNPGSTRVQVPEAPRVSANGDSMAATGELYAQGNGVEKDRATALSWFTRAADAGSVRGMKDLARFYLDDNPAESARWFTKASDLGDADAKYHLGLLYKQGRGVPQSDQLAMELFRNAANSGQLEARAKLRSLAGGVQITGIQPVAILPGPARLYELLGTGLSLRTLVEVSGAQFVGANVGLNRVQEADPDGKWVKVFIGLDPKQASEAVQITVRDGGAESSMRVPVAK